MHRGLTVGIKICVITVALGALADLLGHALHQRELAAILPGLPAISVLTAVGLLCVCGALLAESAQRTVAVGPLAGAAVVIGLTIFVVQIIAGIDWISLPVEHWLFAQSAAFSNPPHSTASKPTIPVRDRISLFIALPKGMA